MFDFDFCILRSGISNVWVLITTFITFSTILIISVISLITKATEKNKKIKSKRIVISSVFSSFFIASLFFILTTRLLFIYEINNEDYKALKYYLINYKKEDVIISRISTKILLCKRKEISKDMKKILENAKKEGYVTYEDLICFSRKSCL